MNDMPIPAATMPAPEARFIGDELADLARLARSIVEALQTAAAPADAPLELKAAHISGLALLLRLSRAAERMGG